MERSLRSHGHCLHKRDVYLCHRGKFREPHLKWHRLNACCPAFRTSRTSSIANISKANLQPEKGDLLFGTHPAILVTDRNEGSFLPYNRFRPWFALVDTNIRIVFQAAKQQKLTSLCAIRPVLNTWGYRSNRKYLPLSAGTRLTSFSTHIERPRS